jgi:Asp-tRNA(Asn)/Glu-tRNA(Gln) amidotransferase A subunit family amidase
MNEIIITESDGTYELESDGVSDFTLIGILECVLFDLKNKRTSSKESPVQIPPVQMVASVEEPAVEKLKIDVPKIEDIKTQATVVPDVRTRITNAMKAIRSLGGQVESIDLDSATEDDLQMELEALTEQYKRLKAKSK